MTTFVLHCNNNGKGIVRLQLINQFSVFMFVSITILSGKLCHGYRSSAQTRSLEEDNNPYRHVEILDPAGKFKVEWIADWEREWIYFNITVETLGWIEFGVSRREKWSGADVIMGGVHSNGKSYFTDRYGTGDFVLDIDLKQDWILHSAWESETHTFLSFSRPFDTCDDKQDVPINEDARYMLWAYGETDDTTMYHFANRGGNPMYLTDPDLTPRIIQEGRNSLEPERLIGGSDVKIWSIQNKFTIPAKRTTFWCNIHKLSLPRKHHIIGFTFKINNETQQNMHHMLLFRCIINNPDSVFEQFVNHPGEECYSQARQLGQIPFQSCIELKAGHAIGGRDLFYPEEMGIPVGATGQNEYYLLQAHYDNPDNREGLISENRLDIYYTSRLRPNDGGIISIGHHIPGAPSLLLPPGSEGHVQYGHCSPRCTRKLLPPNGIKVVAALLHSHNAGRRLALQHFRNNQELPNILKDDNYIINFQPTRLLKHEVTILPGDQVIMRCHYDTTYTNRTTIGGYGADQEMCKTFVVYYNHLEDYTVCRSQLISPAYTARYLGGATNVTWNQPRLEFEATAPPHLAGMTLTDISDSPYVNWSREQRDQLQNDHTFHPQVEVCPSVQEIEAAARLEIQPPPTFVTNPVNDQGSEYRVRPPKSCSLRMG